MLTAYVYRQTNIILQTELNKRRGKPTTAIKMCVQCQNRVNK